MTAPIPPTQQPPPANHRHPCVDFVLRKLIVLVSYQTFLTNILTSGRALREVYAYVYAYKEVHFVFTPRHFE